MLKSSCILLKIAMIFGTIIGSMILAMCPAFFAIGFSSHIHQLLVEAAQEGAIYSSIDISDEATATAIQGVFIALAFVFLVLGGVCVANAIISSRTRNKPSENLYIACIVTGALSTGFSLVAGIFGLICLNKNKDQQKVVLEKEE